MTSYRSYGQHLRLLQSTNNMDALKNFSFCGTIRPAKVVRCIDGDTVEFAMVIDERVSKVSVRLMGVDAPELKPLKSNPDREEIKREARNAKQALEKLIPRGTICAIECRDFDKYGRLLVASIRVAELNVIETLIDQGFVIRVDNEKREKDWSVMWQQLQAKRKQSESSHSSARNLPKCIEKRRWWQRRPFLCCCRN